MEAEIIVTKYCLPYEVLICKILENSEVVFPSNSAVMHQGENISMETLKKMRVVTRQAWPAPSRATPSRLSTNDLLQKILNNQTKIIESQKKVVAKLNKLEKR